MAGDRQVAWLYEPTKRILEIHDYSKDELKELSDEDLRRMAGGRMADAVDGEFSDVTVGDGTDADLRAPHKALSTTREDADL